MHMEELTNILDIARVAVESIEEQFTIILDIARDTNMDLFKQLNINLKVGQFDTLAADSY